MKFKEIDYATYKENIKGYRAGKLRTMIQEFIDSEVPVVEVEYGETEYKSVSSCQGSLYGAVKNMGVMGTVKVTACNGKVFLVNKTKEDF